MTFGAFAMMFRERQMISKIRTHLEIGFDSVCYDVLSNCHCKPKHHHKLSRTLTIEHDPGTEFVLSIDTRNLLQFFQARGWNEIGGIAGRKEREMRVLGAKKEAPSTWDRYRASLAPIALHRGSKSAQLFLVPSAISAHLSERLQ